MFSKPSIAQAKSGSTRLLLTRRNLADEGASWTLAICCTRIWVPCSQPLNCVSLGALTYRGCEELDGTQRDKPQKTKGCAPRERVAAAFQLECPPTPTRKGMGAHRELDREESGVNLPYPSVPTPRTTGKLKLEARSGGKMHWLYCTQANNSSCICGLRPSAELQ